MFHNLSERLSKVVKNLTGQGRLTEANINESLLEVRTSLLEADVSLSVVKQFIEDVKAKALGAEVLLSLRPGDTFIKIVHDELVSIMGTTNETLNLSTTPPAVIMMVGLQGSGKTTTTAKLANLLKTHHKKSVLLASTDIYRPAAMEQLKMLSHQVDAVYFESTSNKPVEIARQALDEAKRKFIDVVIIDTAGRLHIDAEMMLEIKDIHAAIKPVETLFVVDSMTGQDAAKTAQEFNQALPLTGVILTKTDGDARGGAALSIRKITGKPIKFMGVGEKTDALQPFYPDRIASRILGMGDVLSLVEQVEQKIDRAKAEKMAQKIQKGKRFTLEDYREQILQMNNMGGITGLLDKIPGMGMIPSAAKDKINDKMFNRSMAIIDSMTVKERNKPEIINGSRKRRIANGSGATIQDVNRLLKQHEQMEKMMKKMSGKGGMLKMMRTMKHLLPQGGNLPFS